MDTGTKQPIDNQPDTTQLSGEKTSHIKHIDGRTRTARRWRELHRRLSKDVVAIGHGTSTAAALIRRSATLMILAERMEAKLVNGEPVDDLAYVRVSGALSRCLSSLGLDPSVANAGMRTHPQDLGSYIAAKGEGRQIDMR